MPITTFPPPAASGSGTVTSVGLTMPSGFSVSGSPVTSSGTLGVTWTPPETIWGTGASSSNNVASTTDVTVATQSVTGVVSTDIIELEVWGTLLNNSTTTRTYTYTFNVGSASVTIADGTTHAASATNQAVHYFKCRCFVTSTSDSKLSIISTRGTPGAINTGQSIAVTTVREGWNTTAGDLTGTVTVSLAIRSSAATTTQTFTRQGFTVRLVKGT